MAKKKTSKATKKDSSKPVFAAKSKAGKKTSPKKSVAKKASTKKPVSKRSTAKKSATAKSVDSILKGFEKERVSQNSDLIALRKKIEQTTKKIASLKVELLELQAKEGETESAIATLDDRRDKEIGSLLTNLGINLENAAAAAKQANTPDLGTPLFPEDESADEAAKESKVEASV